VQQQASFGFSIPGEPAAVLSEDALLMRDFIALVLQPEGSEPGEE
jgi:hypothetical protein